MSQKTRRAEGVSYRVGNQSPLPPLSTKLHLSSPLSTLKVKLHPYSQGSWINAWWRQAAPKQAIYITTENETLVLR